MKNKLLTLTSTFPRWEKDSSTPPFVYELNRRLINKFDIHVLIPYSKKSKKFEIINGLKIFRFQYWFNKNNNLADGAILPNLKKNKLLWLQIPFFLLFEFLAIKKIIKKYKINTIHAHWIIPQGLLAVLYKKLFNPNVKIIITSHGSDIFKLRYLNFLKKWTLNNCQIITTVSKAIKKEILKLNINNNISIKIISMGVNTELFSPNKCNLNLKKKYNINGAFLLFIGRLSEEKGVKFLIKAMPKIIKDFPDTKLLIIGDGTEKDNLEKQAQKIQLLNKNIVFIKALPNDELPKYYASADIFIGPSLREGLPVTYMETMASGCILIGTNLEGNNDILKNEINGYMIPQKDDLEISTQVINILKNKNNLNFIKNNARKFILNNFDWKIISEKYSDLLK